MEPSCSREARVGARLALAGLIETGAPFALGGLDEALGFAVGARSVGTGARVADAEVMASGDEQAGVVTRALPVSTRQMRMPERA